MLERNDLANFTILVTVISGAIVLGLMVLLNLTPDEPGLLATILFLTCFYLATLALSSVTMRLVRYWIDRVENNAHSTKKTLP